MNEPTAETRPTTFRLDSDVREMLDAFCAETRRTRNSAVNYLLLQALRTPRADAGLELR